MIFLYLTEKNIIKILKKQKYSLRFQFRVIIYLLKSLITLAICRLRIKIKEEIVYRKLNYFLENWFQKTKVIRKNYIKFKIFKIIDMEVSD